MLDQSTMNPVVWLDDHNAYISLIPDAQYNLEVWQINSDTHQKRMGRMDYKFHRDTFAAFIYRLFPHIDLMQIHEIQKQLNPFFDLEV
ncbi:MULTISPECIES: hypothetical protein [Lacticaseibacillus]|uniref:Uncharacterized protein n=2 Tax=Lacticaseibacillus TaxID=2759736 RepID=A0ABW4CI03_9LACO|nr:MULTISPECIES: hypothetical protein [Lacticaseibacillus]